MGGKTWHKQKRVIDKLAELLAFPPSYSFRVFRWWYSAALKVLQNTLFTSPSFDLMGIEVPIPNYQHKQILKMIKWDGQYVCNDTKFYILVSNFRNWVCKDGVSMTKSITSLNFACSLEAHPSHPYQQQWDSRHPMATFLSVPGNLYKKFTWPFPWIFIRMGNRNHLPCHDIYKFNTCRGEINSNSISLPLQRIIEPHSKHLKGMCTCRLRGMAHGFA